MEEEMCKHEDKLALEQPFKYSTTCVVSDKRFTFLTSDRRLAVDIAQWVKERKILVTNFEKVEKDDSDNQITIEIRKKC